MKITQYERKAIVHAIMADVPTPDRSKRHADLQAALVKLMSTPARKVYSATPKALATYYTGDSTYNGVDWDTRTVVIGDVTVNQINALTKPYEVEDEAHRIAAQRLRSAVDSCTTRKQLMDRLPEFEKYYPSADAPMSKNLPALANVVADLAKLGWPKK